MGPIGRLLHLLLLVQNAGRALVQDSQEGQTELLVLQQLGSTRRQPFTLPRTKDTGLSVGPTT